MKKYFLLLLILSIFTNCNNSDCDLYATGPPIILIEFVDSSSNQNIFTSGLHQYSDIEIINSDNESVAFNFINENDYNIIQFIPYSFIKKNTVFIKIKDEITAKITFDIKTVETECFSNLYIENLDVENYPFEIILNFGKVIIKV